MYLVYRSTLGLRTRIVQKVQRLTEILDLSHSSHFCICFTNTEINTEM